MADTELRVNSAAIPQPKIDFDAPHLFPAADAGFIFQTSGLHFFPPGLLTPW